MLSGRVLCTNFCAFLWQFSASLCAPLQLHLHLRRCSCLIIENAKNAKSLNFPARLTYGQAAAEQSAEQAAHSQSLCLQLAHIYRLSCCCLLLILLGLLLVLTSSVASSFTLCTLQQFNCVFALSLYSRLSRHTVKKMYKKFAVYDICCTQHSARARENERVIENTFRFTVVSQLRLLFSLCVAIRCVAHLK